LKEVIIDEVSWMVAKKRDCCTLEWVMGYEEYGSTLGYEMKGGYVEKR